MNFLAFFLGYHDSNVALSVDGHVRYAKSERVFGKKHHKADLDFVKQMCETWGVKHLDAIAFSDVGNYNKMGTCAVDEFFKPVQPLWGNVPTFRVDHHYAHMLSAWPLVDTSTLDAGIAIDGEGDAETRCRVIANPGSSNPKLLYYTREHTFGWLMRDIGNLMGLSGRKLDFAGKIMGIQAYGSVDHAYVDALDIEDIGTHILDLIYATPWQGKLPARQSKLLKIFPRLGRLPVHSADFFDFDNPSFRDWVATVHYVAEMYIVHLFKKYFQADQRIVFAGGCAQNSVCNDKLAREFPQLFIPPHCYDGGVSLGCLEFLRLHHEQPRFSTQGFPFWQSDEDGGYASNATVERVVDLLLQGKIVGWYQGHGEVGPRALGHRTILMDPRQPTAKEVLNSRVKHREHWRPYAPSVLAEAAGDWFEIDEPSPYMLRAVEVKASRRAEVPAIVHQDYTSRIQTVADDGSGSLESYISLLSRFNQATGVPMLLNTSLNAGGSPIFGTRQQCLEFFSTVDLDALCIGDELLTK